MGGLNNTFSTQTISEPEQQFQCQSWSQQLKINDLNTGQCKSNSPPTSNSQMTDEAILKVTLKRELVEFVGPALFQSPHKTAIMQCLKIQKQYSPRNNKNKGSNRNTYTHNCIVLKKSRDEKSQPRGSSKENV